MRYCFDLFSEADTIALGEKIGKNLIKGAFIALSGDLGAGKTVFVKGLAAHHSHHHVRALCGIDKA